MDFLKIKGKEIMKPNKKQLGRGRNRSRSPQILENGRSMKIYLYGMPNQGSSSYKSGTYPAKSREKSKFMNNMSLYWPNYYKKFFKETIFEINQGDYQLAVRPWNIKEKYIGHAPFPYKSLRNRMICEVLLQKLQLVKIEHHSDPNGLIAYSKCIINRVLHQKDWGMSPFEVKKFQINLREISCNYWDYVEAMTNMLYLENSKRKHSWLIVIMPDVAKKEIPSWFYSWWHKFGAEPNILPISIRSKYNRWAESNSQIKKFQYSDLIEGQGLLLYFVECRIPWIWAWSVEVGRDDLNRLCLQRTFFIKWWSKIIEKYKEAQIEAIISCNEQEMKILPMI